MYTILNFPEPSTIDPPIHHSVDPPFQQSRHQHLALLASQRLQVSHPALYIAITIMSPTPSFESPRSSTDDPIEVEEWGSDPSERY